MRVYNGPDDISIHVLREEDDLRVRVYNGPDDISIHVLREEDDHTVLTV